MADPFEVRMRFTSQLQHLNASVTSSQKAAHYALKYRDMDEDLHSCILEQLERNSMNSRANIMYFIEHFCDMARRENHLEFVRMMQRDILAVVDAVTPEDGSGAANVKVVRRVLAGLQQKSFLAADTVAEIEALLSTRDTLPAHATLSPPPASAPAPQPTSPSSQPQTTTTLPLPASQRPYDPSNPNTASTPTTTASPRNPPPQNAIAIPATPTVARPDKRQIEQRIEEDRERHKRLRESIWAVEHEATQPGDGGRDVEFERLWEEGSEMGEDDWGLVEEEAVERREMTRD
ncbi:MAG: hypothetical protein M1817_001326 [Caeruleum heppii]|nr:MAG: hypothetical protein M1817_001326 [Caeruleum heppii]